MIHYLLLGALLAITLVGLTAAVATGLMLVAMRRDQEWIDKETKDPWDFFRDKNYDSKR